MSKGTPLKEAIRQWEERHEGEKITDAEEVRLIGVYPPVDKMDASLSKLPACQKLSLCTNAIEKISNLNALKNLRILSLGRNNIKSFAGLEAVAETLEQLWISYNSIERMKGINMLRKLRVLFMSNNSVKDWSEFTKLSDLPYLEDLVFVGNPLEERYSAEGTWRDEAVKRLSKLKRLDGAPVIR